MNDESNEESIWGFINLLAMKLKKQLKNQLVNRIVLLKWKMKEFIK